MILKNVMSVELHTVSLGMCAEEVAQVMDHFNLSFLPVVACGKPVGAVTSNDLARAVVARGLPGRDTKVSEFMSANPVCLDEDAEIEEAALAMRKHCNGRLLVTRSDGTLSGVFTISDLVMFWAVEDAGEVLRRISETSFPHGYAFTL